VRLILADDTVLFRDALAGALSGRGHEILAQVDDAEALVELVRDLQPDLAVIDIRMPPGDAAGLEAALRIRAMPGRVGVLLLSNYVETVDAANLLGSDASRVGYLLKDRVGDVAELDDAMRRIAGGGSVIDPAVVAAWLGRPRPRGPLDDLTPRERDVLELMAEGRSNAAIASILGTGLKTVETHVAAIFSKLGLEPAENDNRRVIAVVTWLRSAA
jgi:DNA-binding NarL/FixJ family response regulator